MNPHAGRDAVARVVATIALSIVSLSFFTNWPTYQYVVHGGVAPLAYYLGALILAGGIVLLRRRALLPLVREPLFAWFALYAFSGLLWVGLSGGYIDPENRDWKLRFLLASLFSAGLVLSSWADQRRIAWVLFICAAYGAASNWYDFLNPFSYVPVDVVGSNPGRGAGQFINANQAANALVVTGIVAMPFIRGVSRSALILIVLIGVFPTFSRSATILAVVIAAVWGFRGNFGRSGAAAMAIVAPVGALIGYLLFALGIAGEDINYENVVDRLNFFANLGEANDFSASERRYLVELAWEKFIAHPFVGIGVGTTDIGVAGSWRYPQSTHNMYLRLSVEQGVFGALLYLAFIGLIVGLGWHLARYAKGSLAREVGTAQLLLALYFLFLGFFSHTLLQEPVSILALAFLLAAVRKAEGDATFTYARGCGFSYTRNM